MPTRQNFATVGWNAVTTDLGGGALTGLTGYRIYYGTNPSVMSLAVDIPSTTTLSWTLHNFPSFGTWYFDVTAYDPSNNESPHSSQVSKDVTDCGEDFLRFLC
jgi:hypothetical protein